MKNRLKKVIVLSLITLLITHVQLSAQDRTVLPIKKPIRPTYTELDVRNATPPGRFNVAAPEGAPNVVIVLIDDMGFGVTGPFGGPVPCPHSISLPAVVLGTINFILLRFVPRPAWPYLRVTITIQITWDPLAKQPPHSPDTPG